LALCLKNDEFLKSVDISQNRIENGALKNLVRNSLRENNSLVNLDASSNPGCDEKLCKHIALYLLKNIELHQRNGVQINPDWIKQENLTFKIPPKILEGLGISKISEMLSQSVNKSTNNYTEGTPGK
jgi:hypothetical protein